MLVKSMEGNPLFVGSMTTLFVGDLAYACSETDLAALCGRFGVVLSVEIKRGQMGDSLSHGFVEYGSHAMASVAMARLHNLKFMGRKMRCYWGNSSVAAMERDQSPWIQVHVAFTTRQLQMVINEELLDLLFSQFGKVADVCIKRHNYHDREDYRQRGYGFVYFLERRAAMLALLALGKAALDGINFECGLSKRSQDLSMEAEDAAILQEPKPIIRGPRELLSQQTATIMLESQQQPDLSPPPHYVQQQQQSGPPFFLPPSSSPIMFSPPMLLPFAPSLMPPPQHLERQVSPTMMFSHPMQGAPLPYGSGILSPHGPATGNYFPPPQPMGMWLQAPSPPMQHQQLDASNYQQQQQQYQVQAPQRYTNYSPHQQQQHYQQGAPQYIQHQQSPPLLYSTHHSPQYQQQPHILPGFITTRVSPPLQQQLQFVAAPYPVQIQQQPPLHPLHYPRTLQVNPNQLPPPQQQQSRRFP